MAPPFKTAVVDIMYGEGVSKEGELLDLASEIGVVEKVVLGMLIKVIR